MTHNEMWEIAQGLPCVAAPPGFCWDSDGWRSGPTYIAWRRLSSKNADEKSGQILTAMCVLSIGELELPLLERNENARLNQESICASIVNLCVDRALPE
jgi:hypothetical protein